MQLIAGFAWLGRTHSNAVQRTDSAIGGGRVRGESIGG